MLTHPWARAAVEPRTVRTPAVLAFLDDVATTFVAGGLSADLVHHAMHAIGSRVWGFTQDLFDDGAANATALDPATLEALRARSPGLAVVAGAVSHDQGSVVGIGCDDQFEFEFEFALDLLLDGIEERHSGGWSSAGARAAADESAPSPRNATSADTGTRRERLDDGLGDPALR